MFVLPRELERFNQHSVVFNVNFITKGNQNIFQILYSKAVQKVYDKPYTNKGKEENKLLSGHVCHKNPQNVGKKWTKR